MSAVAVSKRIEKCPSQSLDGMRISKVNFCVWRNRMRSPLADRERFLVWTQTGERDATVGGRLTFANSRSNAVSDCRHQGEPGCAAASAGIDEARLAGYAKLQREAPHLERGQDQRAALEEKRRIQRIHRAMRRQNRS